MDNRRKNESFLYFRLAIYTILRKWPFFAISLIFFLLLAFAANKILQPYYQVSSLMLIDLKQENNVQDPAQEFMKSFSIFNPTSDIQREILKMKSTELVRKAIESSNLRISYFKLVDVRKRELFSRSPITMEFVKNHVQPFEFPFDIKLLGNHKYAIKAIASNRKTYFEKPGEEPFEKEVTFKLNKVAKFGDTIQDENYAFVLHFDSAKLKELNSPVHFIIETNDINKLVLSYQSSLSIEQVAKDIHAVSIRLKTPDPKTGINFVNALTAAYLQRNVEKKNNIANNTITYLDNQLATVEDSLKLIEEKLQAFRSSNQIMEVGPKAEQLFKSNRDLEAQRDELLAREKYYEYINTNLEKVQDGSKLIVPSTMGVNDNVLTSLIEDYIRLNTERNNLTQNKQTQSPYFASLTTKIDNEKNTLHENLKYLINLNTLLVNNLSERIKEGQTKISLLPSTERTLVGIERKYQLNDNIYTFMLKKKAEAQAAKASNLSEYDILESAQLVSPKPVSPNKPLNYIAAFIVGLLFPFGWLGLRGFLNNTVTDPEEIKSMTSYPTLGNILLLKKKASRNVLIDQPQSTIAESIRTVRNNLEDLLLVEGKSVILFTSPSASEGKSFVAYNLAVALAQTQKKVVLLDFELRKANNYPIQLGSQSSGIIDVLSGTKSIPEVIQKTTTEGLYFIKGGQNVAPVSDLLSKKALEKLIADLKTVEGFDYILLDTPPFGIISDTQVLMRHADLITLVIRQNKTAKFILANLFSNLSRLGNKNISWIFNSYDSHDKMDKKSKVYFK